MVRVAGKLATPAIAKEPRLRRRSREENDRRQAGHNPRSRTDYGQGTGATTGRQAIDAESRAEAPIGAFQ